MPPAIAWETRYPASLLPSMVADMRPRLVQVHSEVGKHLAAAPSPSRIRPSRRCSVPM